MALAIMLKVFFERRKNEKQKISCRSNYIKWCSGTSIDFGVVTGGPRRAAAIGPVKPDLANKTFQESISSGTPELSKNDMRAVEENLDAENISLAKSMELPTFKHGRRFGLFKKITAFQLSGI